MSTRASDRICDGTASERRPARSRVWGRRAVACAAPVLCAVVAVLMISAGGAVAQAAPKPPTPADSDTSPVILNIVLAVLVVGAIGGASVLPSKRGHQD